MVDVMILVVWEHGEDEEVMALVSGAGEVAGSMWDALARNRSQPGSWELISRTAAPRIEAEEQARKWLAEHGYEVQR